MTRQMKIGAFLKILREAKGLTIEQVCQDLGTVYASAEKGKNIPTLLTIFKILDYFKADRMAACRELEYIPKEDDQTFRYLVLRKAILDRCSVKDVLRECKCYPILYETRSLTVLRPFKSFDQFREMAQAFGVSDKDFAARMPTVNLQEVADRWGTRGLVSSEVLSFVKGKASESLLQALRSNTKGLLSKASLGAIAECAGLTYSEAFLWYMEVQEKAIEQYRVSGDVPQAVKAPLPPKAEVVPPAEPPIPEPSVSPPERTVVDSVIPPTSEENDELNFEGMSPDDLLNPDFYTKLGRTTDCLKLIEHVVPPALARMKTLQKVSLERERLFRKMHTDLEGAKENNRRLRASLRESDALAEAYSGENDKLKARIDDLEKSLKATSEDLAKERKVYIRFKEIVAERFLTTMKDIQEEAMEP
ncbi:MAG: helix-turn-helix transcriptional regulator [Dehalococcoidia bacterium]|jgi:transcriptional regulator with XRE-family HTH domain